MDSEFQEFIEEFENNVIDLSKELNLSNFNATISGKAEDFILTGELDLKLKKIFSNNDDYEKLKMFKNSYKISDAVNKREIDILYNTYAQHQIEDELLEKIVELSNKIEQTFSTYRAEIEGKKLTDNQIDKVLEISKDSEKLEATWSASKQIGEIISKDVIELAKLRNKAADQLGYNGYHEMSLKLNEMEPEYLDQLFDELEEKTEDKFNSLKNDIDYYLSDYYSMDKNELMPWHYQDKFFQHGPKIYDLDLDNYFADQNIEKVTENYFNSIGLRIADILKISDLYEKEGKYQHAYCTQIDREGDIRVVCNIKPNYKWMGTMLHEFGHAVYFKYVSPKLPWSLREHSHIFTTEAIAMLFGRFASNPHWLKNNIGISESETKDIAGKSFKILQLEQLLFSRWVQVIYRFEKAMFEDPNRDLNALWWELVEKYQGLKKPAERDKPDWAAKIHIALYPVYYQNYMLGELLASQLYFYIKDKVIKEKSQEMISFVNNPNVGEYLTNLFFSYGSFFKWDKLIKTATGEELNLEYWINQFAV